MKLKKNQIIGIVLLIFTAIVGVMVAQFDAPIVNAISDPGPKLFPIIGLVLVGVGSVGLLQQKTEEEEPSVSSEEKIRILKMLGLYIAYTLGLWLFGFLIATPIALFAVMHLMAMGKKLKLPVQIGYSVVVTVVLYVLFSSVMKFMLPKGLLLSLF